MDAFAAGLGDRGIRVARFEFPYMESRRRTGKKRPPDRQPILLQSWREVIARIGEGNLIIGGKSMGGRMATLLAAEDDPPPLAGLVCLGYPFHPPGKPDRMRTEHLEDLRLPCLIAQGERDAMGNHDEVSTYSLSESIQLHWCPDGNHDLTPRKKSGHTQEDNWAGAMDAVAAFAVKIGQ